MSTSSGPNDDDHRSKTLDDSDETESPMATLADSFYPYIPSNKPILLHITRRSGDRRVVALPQNVLDHHAPNWTSIATPIENMLGEYTVAEEDELGLVTFVTWVRLHTIPPMLQTITSIDEYVKTLLQIWRFGFRIRAKGFMEVVSAEIRKIIDAMKELGDVLEVVELVEKRVMHTKRESAAKDDESKGEGGKEGEEESEVPLEHVVDMVLTLHATRKCLEFLTALEARE